MERSLKGSFVMSGAAFANVLSSGFSFHLQHGTWASTPEPGSWEMLICQGNGKKVMIMMTVFSLWSMPIN